MHCTMRDARTAAARRGMHLMCRALLQGTAGELTRW